MLLAWLQLCLQARRATRARCWSFKEGQAWHLMKPLSGKKGETEMAPCVFLLR